MKKLFALVLAMVIVFSFASTVMAAETFTRTNFIPVDLTRAAFVDVIYRAESVFNGKDETCANVFADVETDSYYENAISWAAEKGIVKGVSDTTFDPNTLITREQLATMMYRYYEYKGTAPEGAWAIKVEANDLENVSSYAMEGVMFAVLNGVLAVDENGNLNPTTPIATEEIQGIVTKLYMDLKRD